MTSSTFPLSAMPAEPLPRTTLGISALLTTIFLAQAFAANNLVDLPIETLLPFGALYRDMVLVCGDWWRLFTAPMLHGGILHLGLNLVALFFAGRFIELHLGGPMLAGLLGLGGVAGALASLTSGGTLQVSLGASGGIMALLAAALLLCYTLPEAADTISGRSLFWRILVPSLIPTHSGIDYAAHFGGAIAGAALGAGIYVLGVTQASAAVRTALGGIAALACIGCAAFGGARLIHFALATDLPALTADATAAEKHARAQLAMSTHDPAARLAMALALLDNGHAAEAERQAVLGYRQALNGSYGQGLVLPSDLRVTIALARAASGRIGDAHSIIESECPAVSKQLQQRVARAKLCT